MPTRLQTRTAWTKKHITWNMNDRPMSPLFCYQPATRGKLQGPTNLPPPRIKWQDSELHNGLKPASTTARKPQHNGLPQYCPTHLKAKPLPPQTSAAPGQASPGKNIHFPLTPAAFTHRPFNGGTGFSICCCLTPICMPDTIRIPRCQDLPPASSPPHLTMTQLLLARS